MLAFVALLSMTIGIGANTAIFSLLNQILLRTLPVQKPQELVILKANGPNNGRMWDDGTHTSFSYPLFQDVAAQTRIFSGAFARFSPAISTTHDGVTERGLAELVTGQYFPVLGVKPAIGRTLTPDDDRQRGGSPVAVLSYNAFRARFGANPAVLNRTVLLNGHPFTIVGVAQSGFTGFQVGTNVDFFVPMAMVDQIVPEWKDLTDRRSQWLQIVARRQPGVSLEQAQVALNTVYKPILAEELKKIPARSERFRQEFLNKTISLLEGGRGHSPLRGDVSTPLIALMAMVGLVLLIACANVANLLLSRAAGRQKEIAIRLSIGASRSRLISQLLTESLLLSVGGGILGLALAVWTTRALLAFLPMRELTDAFHGGIDPTVLAFTAGLALFTGLLFGLVPAFQTTRPDLAITLKEQANATTGGSSHVLLRKALVVGQVALSLVLLIGAGLFAHSLLNLRSIDTGVRTDHVMTFSIDPSLNNYSDAQVFQTYDRIQRSLGGIPGVRSVSMSAMPLLAGSEMGMGLKVPGYQAKEGEDSSTMVNLTGPGYLAAVGLPLINGRDIGEKDATNAPLVAVVNETLAHKYFGQESPIGRHIEIRHQRKNFDAEVIGVVHDFKHGSVRDERNPFVFMPYNQWIRSMGMTFYVRTTQDPAAFGETITRTVRGVDSNLPVYDMKTLEEQASESLFVERAIAMLASAFGFLATLLAAVGLYGVMAYSVVSRTREIGIRMALGASTADVRSMIMGQVMTLVAIGIVIAIPLAMLLTRFVKSQLYGLTGNDPLTIAGAVVAIVVVGAIAGFVPAARAVRISPTVALRYE